MEERKVAGILLILLALSLELNRHAILRVNTQTEDFASRLENYLGKAIPDNLLAEECEYVVPDGFNLSFAERLWRDFSLHVSAGYTTDELRSEVEKIYDSPLLNATLSNRGTITLNLSSISVDRSLDDGSVSVKIPVVSSISLNYTRYNFTKTAGFYEVWNKTLVREYRVWRREPGWYLYSFEDLESNKSFTVVSRIWGESSRVEESWLEGLRKLGGGAWNEPVRYLPSFEYTKWGCLRTSGPVIAVPGHYEDVRVIVPQQKVKYRVLFPAYDPIIIEGWIIHVNVSSTSLNVGESLEVSYLAEYCSPWGGGSEPLNATLILEAPDAFEPLNGVERKLDDTHTSGVFRLKAVKPGTYNITLRLEGNAVFANTASKKETYTVQITSPPAPSLSIEIVERDTSVLKHAKLVLRLRNNGGGPARNIVLEASGRDMEAVSKSLGSIEIGESRDFELILRLLQPASLARIIVKYSDDEGNPYLVGFETMVSTETFWVPEHFEEYTVVVPEHEETLRVFVPGYEAATHIRFYALWDERILGEAIFYAERVHSPFPYETSLSMGLIPIPIPGLGVELSIDAGRQALTEAGVNIMVKSIEPYYEYLGIINEDDTLTLTGADKQFLRSGNISSDYRVEPLKPYWVKHGSIVLNATQLALYQAKMEEAKKANPDLDYEYRETVADVRTRVGTAEAGYVTLVYRPLKTSGEGPLKGVRVRNFAGIGFYYRVDVESSILTVFGKARSENGWKQLYLSGKEDAVLLSPSPGDGFERLVTVNLTYNGRLVAGARFTLKPESSPYWKGFWDGLASQAWKIVISVGLMVIVGFFVPAQHVVTASRIILGVGVAMNLLEVGTDILKAYEARDAMNALANETLERAIEYLAKGEAEHAEECVELAHRLRVEADATINNLGINVLSELFVDVTWDEVNIAFGWKEPLVLPGENRDYKVGYATGRVAGAVVLCMLYGAFYAMVTKIKAERIAGEPLSVSQVLRLMARGIYNWITPAIWDAVVLMRGKIGGFTSSVVDLLLGNKYSSRFGEAVGSLLEDTKGEFPKVGDTLDASSGISKHVLENVPSKESSSRILDAIGSIVENYSPEELKEKGKTIVRSIVSMWIKDGDEAIDSLNSWLSTNMKDMDKMDPLERLKVVEKIRALEGILLKIDGDAAKEVGLRIGSIVDGYLKVKGKYDEDTAEAFIELALKNPDKLESIVEAFKCSIFMETHSVTLKRGSMSTIVLSERFEEGVYIVRVHWQYEGTSGVAEFPVSTKGSNVIQLPIREANEVLDLIGKNIDEATVKVTKISLLDYRLFFPSSFTIGSKQIGLDLFNNRIMLGMKPCMYSAEADHIEEIVLVKTTLESGDTMSKPLTLVFYSDGKVSTLVGHHKIPVQDIQIDAVNEAVTLTYVKDGSVCTPVYSLKAGDLDSAINKAFRWEEDVEGRGHIGLKEKLLVLLGYQAYQDFKEEIGSKYGVLVEFDNGRKAYTGEESIAVHVPEGARKIETIVVVSIEEKIRFNLHEIMKYFAQGEVKGAATSIGRVSEHIVYHKHLLEIENLIIQKLGEEGVSEEQIMDFKNKVVSEQLGTESTGQRVTDIVFRAQEAITLGKKTFRAGDIIIIVEIKGTTKVDSSEFEERFSNAIESLKGYINSEDYKTAKYGVAVAFGFDPEEMLWSLALSNELSYPGSIGPFENPRIEIFTREELLGGG